MTKRRNDLPPPGGNTWIRCCKPDGAGAASAVPHVWHPTASAAPAALPSGTVTATASWSVAVVSARPAAAPAADR